MRLKLDIRRNDCASSMAPPALRLGESEREEENELCANPAFGRTTAPSFGRRRKRGSEMTRQEHLDWCKKRALEYANSGDIKNAFASMASDMSKHEETKDHLGVSLGALMLLSDNMQTAEDARKWIDGFN